MVAAAPPTRYSAWLDECSALIKDIDVLHTSILSSDNDIAVVREKERQLAELRERYIHEVSDSSSDDDDSPMVGDKRFQMKVRERFGRGRSDAAESDVCSSAVASENEPGFQLSSTQRFLRDFFRPGSSYSSLLLFHGVGVGKTCAAIGVAQEFPNVKKVLVFTPPLIVSQFRRQIFDVNKLAFSPTNKNKLDVAASARVQCTGDRYLLPALGVSLNDTDGNGTADDVATLKHNIARVVDDTFEVRAFGAVARILKGFEQDVRFRHPGASPQVLEELVNAKIRYHFSDRVIVIDEVHKLRDAGDDEEKHKLLPPIFLRVIRHAQNVKLLLLSATPMFNEVSEVVWLANILLLNDKRPPLEERKIFDSFGRLLPGGEALLSEKLNGYISYAMPDVSSELFPRQLRGSIASDLERMPPDVDHDGVRIPESQRISEQDFAGLALSTMSPFQRSKLGKQKAAKTESSTPEESSSAHHDVNISNIAYPLDGSLRSNFTYSTSASSKRKKYSYTAEVLASPHGRFLEMDKLAKYSCKIHAIVREILAAPGPVFVFSRYIERGVLPLALALEHVGFSRMSNGGNLLAGAPPSRLKYALVCGERELSDALDAVIHQFNSAENAYGEVVKVLIGTEVLVEGVDLRHVRQVHVLEPWFHMKKIEQLIGRAVRRCSHMLLKPEERDVTVFLHAAVVDGGDGDDNRCQETVDLRHYRQSFAKVGPVARVEKVMREASVDYCLSAENASSAARCASSPSSRRTLATLSHRDDFHKAAQKLSNMFFSGDGRVTRSFMRVDAVLDALSMRLDCQTTGCDDDRKKIDAVLAAAAEDRRGAGATTRLVRYGSWLTIASDGRDRGGFVSIREREGTWLPDSSWAVEMTLPVLAEDGGPAAEVHINTDIEDIVAKVEIGRLKLLENLFNTDFVEDYEQELYDYVIDRLPQADLLALMEHFLRVSPETFETLSVKRIRDSLEQGGYVFDRYAHDVYTNRFYKAAGESPTNKKNCLTPVDPYELKTQTLPLARAAPQRQPPPGKSTVGFMAFDKKSSRFVFKVVQDGVISMRGTICEEMGLGKEKLAQIIQRLDPRMELALIKKAHMCHMYELLLRAARPAKFARPPCAF